MKGLTMKLGNYVNQVKGQDAADSWFDNESQSWAIWAIDGAYPLVDGNNSRNVEELSQNLSYCLKNEFENNGIRNIRESLKSSLSQLSINENDSSTTTLTMATSYGEILTLGDSEAILENTNNKHKRIMAPDFYGVEEKILAKIQELLEQGFDNETAYFSVKDELIDRRNRRNEINNSSGWVIARKNIEMIHQYAYIEKFDPKSNICVFTDGFSRLIDWNIIDNLFETIHENSLEENMRTLRKIEQEDCLKLKRIRFSVSDDAAAAWKINSY